MDPKEFTGDRCAWRAALSMRRVSCDRFGKRLECSDRATIEGLGLSVAVGSSTWVGGLASDDLAQSSIAQDSANCYRCANHHVSKPTGPRAWRNPPLLPPSPPSHFLSPRHRHFMRLSNFLGRCLPPTMSPPSLSSPLTLPPGLNLPRPHAQPLLAIPIAFSTTYSSP